MHKREVHISDAIREMPDARPNLTEATEILVELIDAGDNVVRWARLSLLDSKGFIRIMNRNASVPLRLRASVNQTCWPMGEIVKTVLSQVDLPLFL